MTKSEASLGLLFPGQGAHGPTMLNSVANYNKLNEFSEPILKELDAKSLADIVSDPKQINQNKTSSLLTVLVSALMLEMWRTSEKSEFTYSAGYSVGQWTAIYAAGGVSYQQLIRIVAKRSEFMNQCIEKTPSGMMAVIGVPEILVEEFCESIRKEGHFITISNYNCARQYSLAGTLEAIEIALEKIQDLSPKKVVQLPVSGGWHCSILNEASTQFFEYLRQEPIDTFTTPVLDNVTGEFLPTDENLLKKTLAKQISTPVQWEKCIQHLIENGCNEFIEIGYGQILTMFGLFINRHIRNISYSMQLEKR
ncbi:ACP S-malonyltransferase [Desulfovibrio inopinatus]|uniref:ACP S-malonyltransferase n=1 Tax=Desulfovibrio inopinatus TaxID=102109 RepID=UPI00042966A9|nr:ACP S-malonyltransferase [Desulfovibrio inopinatus]